MTDYSELKRLIDRLTTDRRFCADEHHKNLAEGATALIAENEQLAAQVRLARVSAEMAIHDAIGRATNDYLLVCIDRDNLKATIFDYQMGVEAAQEEIHGLKAEIEVLRSERDHADRLLGVAERVRESSVEGRKYTEQVLDTQDKWLREATVEMGYPSHEVFDVVWEDTRRDALRYRWLRKQQIHLDGHDFLSTQEILDHRVDAAMIKESDQ